MTEPTSKQTRLHELFTAALHLPPAQQEPYLLRSCPDDPALVREVLALLHAADAAPDDFLTPPDPPSFMSKATPHPPAPYDPAKDTLPGRRLKGRYTIQHRLGEGGMSVVYEGAQDHPHRRVAVKIMRPQFVSPKVLRRFRDEPEILAQLNHPHIVRVFEADVEDFGAGDGPQPYFVMEYVDGIPLTQYARQQRLPLRERLELFAIVCDAVHEAHQRGIIHRDLKPGNILVTAGGQPKLLDFGVAKVLATSGLAIEHTLTGELQLIGTLQYMSPEQCDVGLPVARTSGACIPPTEPRQSGSRFPVAQTYKARNSPPEPRPSGSGFPVAQTSDVCNSPPEPPPSGISPHPNPLPAGEGTAPPSPREGAGGGPAPVSSLQSPVSSLDTRSDVYALGVLLYELVTERLPYDVSNMTIVSAARTICEAAPPPPSHFDRRLRGDLDAIILKALEKNRAHRYASAAHLEDDVRRYLSGEPTTARPTTWRTRATRWMRKHPTLATAAIAFSAGVLTWIPTMLAWEQGFRRGVQAVPWRFKKAFNQSSVELMSFDGRTLAAFDAGDGGRVRVAEVLESSRSGGRDMRVVVGLQSQPASEEPNALVVYRWDQPKQSLEPVGEQSVPDPGLLPDPHDRKYSAADFRFATGIVADVFNEKESKGDEIVTVFQGGGFTQSVLQIHDLDGQLLYRVWADAQFEEIIWQPDSRLLICVGGDGSAFRCAREGMPENERAKYRHIKVVFAFRPEFNKRHDTFMCLEPEPIPGTIAPEWCRMIGPWDLVDACFDHAFLDPLAGGGFRLQVIGRADAASMDSLSIEFGPDGSLAKRSLDADNVKAALVHAAPESILYQFAHGIDLLLHPPIRDEWIPIKQKGEDAERLYYLRDCEADPAGGPPIPHLTQDCPLNHYGVHGSPYRWARLLRDGKGTSTGCPQPPSLDAPSSPP